MQKMKYIKGDVREPEGEGNKIIAHCCNDLGVMGAGVAKALFQKWPSVKSNYIKWAEDGLILGSVQFVKVEPSIIVANMIGQHDIRVQDDIPPVRYPAMATALEKVGEAAVKYKATVHVPYLMGSALAGGNWEEVVKIIEYTICQRDITVIAYDIN